MPFQKNGHQVSGWYAAKMPRMMMVDSRSLMQTYPIAGLSMVLFRTGSIDIAIPTEGKAWTIVMNAPRNTCVSPTEPFRI
jgi:hypothetical protein